MLKQIRMLWAKSDPATARWHPLLLHLLDVAAVADGILAREPDSTRAKMASVLGLTWIEARPWILLLIACHDLGKACPGFQCKWKNLSELDAGRSPDTDINHAFVSQIALADLLRERGWPDALADLVSDAAGCHHGNRASPSTVNNLSGNRRALGASIWNDVRGEIFEQILSVLKPALAPNKPTLSGSDFMILAGLTSFSDWIGSNEDWFSFGSSDECSDLNKWFDHRKTNVEKALDSLGWLARTPLINTQYSFEQVFKFQPRPLQKAISEAVIETQNPAVFLIEAPMGEGKTEAAFFAYLELQRKLGHRGMYVALPTKATGNAMFKRTLKFLKGMKFSRTLDMQLLHGGTLLNDDFQNIKVSGIYDNKTEGSVRASEWFTNKKRALLSEYGVGTVDQALLTILPVRHQFVRLWGLANRVVIFDEIHAYDAYTGTLLIHLIHWLLALGSSIILLSATLPPAFRRELAKIVKSKLPEQEASYPRLSIFQQGKAPLQTHFSADPSRKITIQLQAVSPELTDIRDGLLAQLQTGGMALALVNTVQRAQDLYRLFEDGEILTMGIDHVGKKLPDGTEIFLFHARFPADKRQVRENHVLSIFGEGGKREGRKILIATQVVEQSLDLDFDVMATDLAPVDLVLQRAGRLWRHKREHRPVKNPTLIVAGLAGDTPPDFGKPLWWSAVYREAILLRSWMLLKPMTVITLPDQIDTLIRNVYEDDVSTPPDLTSRMEKAIHEEGEVISHRQQAHAAIIGLPDDASWNDPAKFTLYDEDEPGIHKTLMAQTRLGEDSVIAIPIFSQDTFDTAVTPDFNQVKTWYLRAVSISRKNAVNKLKKQGVPEGWRKSALLRNCYPLILGVNNRWQGDVNIRLDDDLGLVYENKETE